MTARITRVAIPVAWGTFFVWLLVTGEVYRYIGPRTHWVVIFGAVALIAVAVAVGVLGGDETGGSLTWGVVVMLLPIVAVLAVPRPSLGSLAASRKLSGGPVTSLQTVPSGGDISFPEIEYASRSEDAATVGVADGMEVELTGFVTHNDPVGDFSLTRFSIFCCAADVVPHSVDVVAERDYPDDVWLTVEGVLESRAGTFVVIAEEISEVDEPRDPYLR